jgi:hypothetical protein
MAGVSRSLNSVSRHEYGNPYSIFPLILGGGLFLLAGLVLIGKHDMGRALAWLAIGAGMVAYGLADCLLRESRWRLPGLLVTLALWFGVVYWALGIAL